MTISLADTTPRTYDHGTCRCGRIADKTSSGSPECWPCWNYRKLDRPAALHWAEVLKDIWSNIDMYDMMTYFPDSARPDENMNKALNTLLPLFIRSWLLVRYGPEHTWSDKIWNFLCTDKWFLADRHFDKKD